MEECVPSRHNSFSLISHLLILNFRPLPGHLGATSAGSPYGQLPAALTPWPRPALSVFLLLHNDGQGPRPSCLSLFSRPRPNLGRSLPIFTLCIIFVFSELLRGFSLKAMKRNLQTAGSILSWVSIEGKRKAEGWGGRTDGGWMWRGRDTPHAPPCHPPFKQLHQQIALPKCLSLDKMPFFAHSKGKDGQRAET